MKTKTLIFAIALAIFLPCALLFAGCGENIEDAQNNGEISAPTITGWYESGEENLLDTSINIDFDKVSAENIHSIKFTLYDGQTMLGIRECSGDQVETLLKDCAQYWDQTEGTWSEVEGVRTLSCAFKNRTSEAKSDFWTSTTCTATPGETPNRLIVEIVVEKDDKLLRYKSEKNA